MSLALIYILVPSSSRPADTFAPARSSTWARPEDLTAVVMYRAVVRLCDETLTLFANSRRCLESAKPSNIFCNSGALTLLQTASNRLSRSVSQSLCVTGDCSYALRVSLEGWLKPSRLAIHASTQTKRETASTRSTARSILRRRTDAALVSEGVWRGSSLPQGYLRSLRAYLKPPLRVLRPSAPLDERAITHKFPVTRVVPRRGQGASFLPPKMSVPP